MIRRSISVVSLSLPGLALVGAGLAATPPSATCDQTCGDIRAITAFENAEIQSDLNGDVAFYARNLTDDYTHGTSWGTWYTKASLLADLRDTKANHSTQSRIWNIKVRVYGDAAIATYDQHYDAIVLGQKKSRDVINTDVFIRKGGGRWLLWASHTSAVIPHKG